tara:strand:- start:240 stop:3623 length:3384 start_codon:yes stop_codon:yes gene_type:complete
MKVKYLLAVMDIIGQMDIDSLKAVNKLEIERLNNEAEFIIANQNIQSSILELQINYSQDRYDTLVTALTKAAELEQKLEADRSRYSPAIVNNAANLAKNNVNDGFTALARVYDSDPATLNRVGRIQRPHALRMFLAESGLSTDGGAGQRLFEILSTDARDPSISQEKLNREIRANLKTLMGKAGEGTALYYETVNRFIDGVEIDREIANFQKTRFDLPNTLKDKSADFFENNVEALNNLLKTAMAREEQARKNYGAEVQTLGAAEQTKAKHDDYKNKVANYEYYFNLAQRLGREIEGLSDSQLQARNPQNYEALLRSLIDGDDTSWAAQNGFRVDMVASVIDGRVVAGGAAMNALDEFYRQLNAGNVARLGVGPVSERTVLGRRFGPLGRLDRPKQPGIVTVDLSSDSEQVDDLLGTFILPKSLRTHPEFEGKPGIFALVGIGDDQYLASPREVMQILEADGPSIAKLSRNTAGEIYEDTAAKLLRRPSTDFTLFVDKNNKAYIRIDNKTIDLDSPEARDLNPYIHVLREEIAKQPDAARIPLQITDEQTDKAIRWASVDEFLENSPQGTTIDDLTSIDPDSPNTELSIENYNALMAEGDAIKEVRDQHLDANLHSLKGTVQLVGRDGLPQQAKFYGNLGRRHAANIADGTHTFHTEHGVMELDQNLVKGFEQIGSGQTGTPRQFVESLRFKRNFNRAIAGLPVDASGRPQADRLGGSDPKQAAGGLVITDSTGMKGNRRPARRLVSMTDQLFADDDLAKKAIPKIDQLDPAKLEIVEVEPDEAPGKESDLQTRVGVAGLRIPKPRVPRSDSEKEETPEEETPEGETPDTPSSLALRFMRFTEDLKKARDMAKEREESEESEESEKGEPSGRERREIAKLDRQDKREGSRAVRQENRIGRQEDRQKRQEDRQKERQERQEERSDKLKLRDRPDLPEETPLDAKSMRDATRFLSAKDRLLSSPTIPIGGAKALSQEQQATVDLYNQSVDELEESLAKRAALEPESEDVQGEKKLIRDELYTKDPKAIQSAINMAKQHPRFTELMQGDAVKRAMAGAEKLEDVKDPRDLFNIFTVFEDARKNLPAASPTPSSTDSMQVPGSSGLNANAIPEELSPVFQTAMDRRNKAAT